MKTINIPISSIENNTGQVDGLPPNPRLQNEAKLEKLMTSIQQDPELLQLRGLLVYPIEKNKYITIGGNMRLQALKRLGFVDVPCVVIPQHTPIDKLRNYIIKDNGDFGDWDYQALLSSWDTIELQEWAIDIPELWLPQEEQKRAGWNTSKDSKESLCDLKDCISWHKKQEFSFISCFKKSEQGYPLSQIKSDFSNVRLFVEAAQNVIQRTIGLKEKKGWGLLTTPKRRHKENNFAEAVCESLAKELQIPFYKEAVSTKTRQRINPTFSLNVNIPERNLIVFDDILTTGSTLVALNKLFPDKNCFYLVGINNN